MNISSTSFSFRSSCKWCHSLPTTIHKYHNWVLPEDITPNHYGYHDDVYILGISFMGELMRFKDTHTKLKFGQFQYFIDYLRSNPRFHRKYNYRNINIQKSLRSCVSRCLCGRSYWVDLYYDKEMYPENNRKRIIR